MIKKIASRILAVLLVFLPKRILMGRVEGLFNKKDNTLLTLSLRRYFDKCYKNSDTEGQKELSSLLWRSSAATGYFQQRDFSENIVNKFYSIILESNCSSVCEIGTGNGRLIGALSRMIPDCFFKGIDLNENQIELNTVYYSDNKRLSFISKDALGYLAEDTDTEKKVYISYVSLTTFTPEMANRFFEIIAKRSAPSVVVIYEPVPGSVAGSNISQKRDGLAYAHNYITIVEKNHFIIKQKSFADGFLWLVCEYS